MVCVKQLKFFAALHMSANDHKSAMTMDFEATNNFNKLANAQTYNRICCNLNCESFYSTVMGGSSLCG